MTRRYVAPLVLACLAVVMSSCGGAATTPAPPAPRQIALTFDDAPRGDGAFFSGPQRADALIAALDEAGVAEAMFFVLTGNIAAHRDGEDRLRAYARAGHTLANHSHTHPSLLRTGVPAYLADIDTASAILKELPSVRPFFRYPFLHEGRGAVERADMEAGLAARGLRNGYVTVDNYDWYMEALVTEAVRAGSALDMAVLRDMYVETLTATVEFYDGIAREAIERSPVHVLLLHENDLAAMFVDDLVRALRDGGWAIVPASDAFADPIGDRAPETDFNGQGRVASLAAEAGWTPRQLIHESEDEAFLRAEFVRSGLLPSE
jgi:peptidoglycan/xylan/chitin deacetylase (PgdA/CDA1 family)